MSVHYKFKSALDYDTVTFDGLHISVGDLKAAISQQKRIGKTSDFDLQITNAQTKEVYIDDGTLIPKNTSLLVARVPLSQQPKKQWEGSNNNATLHKDVSVNKGLADLSRMEGSEQDKINAMISQSTFDYDPSNYQKIRGQNQRGAVPSTYICYKCQKYGHWIKDCPTANSSDPIEIRRSTGIPRSFMVPVDGPKAPGAMMTPSGSFAVPAVDHEAYLASESAGGADTATAPAAPEPTIPDELICSLCRDLLTDAVMIPCCGNSFCDECIRGALLESEDHECPDCREKEIAPTTLIPNRFLRNSVSSFRNQTGYSRRAPHRPSAAPPVLPNLEQPPPVMAMQPPPNGPPHPPVANNDTGAGSGSESDGSSDNITVLVPPRYRHRPGDRPGHKPGDRPGNRPDNRPGNRPDNPPGAPRPGLRRDMHRHPLHGPPGLKPPGMETPPNMPMNAPRVDEQRASTPTIDEGRDPIAQGPFNRGAPPFVPGVPPPGHRFNNPPYRGGGRRGAGSRAPFSERFPPEPYQPPPPGIKDSPNGHGEDPLEAFNRMIREKEMRAARREVERRRAASGTPSRSRSRSPRPPRASPRPRSPSPRGRRPPRPPSRHGYSRSRSISRGRVRRSPWSPRRRRSRDRSLSLSRSPSPRRRHRSPMRYRSPLRTPLRSPPRSPLRSPPRSPLRSPPRSPLRSPLRSPHRTPLRSPLRSPIRSPIRSPRRSAMRSPPPRAMTPHRYPGLYDELLSPPRRNVEPPYGPRFGPRINAPPPIYPNMGVKPIPPLSSIPIQEPPPGYRGRYDAPPFEDIPPGLEPAVPGFEPSPFEKPPYAPPGPIDRERMPPSNYRDPYRAPFVEGPPGYRDMPIPPVQSEIPVHVGDAPRYRDNFRPGHPYRDQGPIPYREGQSFRDAGQPVPYRDPGFRGGPPAPFRDNYRNVPFREGGFRDNPPHGFRDGPVPFRPPSVDLREPLPGNYHDPAFRDGFRDENNPSREMRPGYNRPGVRNRGPSRRNPNFEQERHREPDGRDRERFGDNRDPAERARDMEKRSGYEKGRENREGREDRPREERSRGDRPRDHERNREYDKEREREHERGTPDKKVRGSPKRSRDTREKRRSESRGRSRDREGRRDKKDERLRDKTSSERTKEHKDKEKEKKLKDRKKKKREKEKDADKKKKKDKKDKKDKDGIKKDDDETEKSESKDDDGKELNKVDTDTIVDENKPSNEGENHTEEKIKSPTRAVKEEPQNDLYGDEPAEAIDKEIIQNYVKSEENEGVKQEVTESSNVDPGFKEEPFDGIELQVTADELDLKADIEGTTEKEMLAPLPELSKWEVDDDNTEKKEPGEITSPEEEDSGKVTSEVLKRAENAIFAKAINSLRPIEIKKISSDRLKLYDDTQSKGSMNNIQITVPVADPEHRSIEMNDKNRKRTSKTPPPRLSIKERLGGKVDDVRRSREPRVVHSTVERVKSRSKTPKKEQPYRRVTVDRDRSKKTESLSRSDLPKEDKPRLIADARGLQEQFSSRSPNRDKKRKDFEKSGKEPKAERKVRSEASVDSRGQDKSSSSGQKTSTTDRERKKSTLDESHFEPDYDETVESDHEGKDESVGKKRERSMSQSVTSDVKKPKLEEETIKLDLANVKKKPETETESSSDSSSSSSSSDARKRKKKKKRSSKKKKKRVASDSESESDSDSDDHKKKKKKRKHKKKSSKKKKKSKHK